jgi:hypothetical protein
MIFPPNLPFVALNSVIVHKSDLGSLADQLRLINVSDYHVAAGGFPFATIPRSDRSGRAAARLRLRKRALGSGATGKGGMPAGNTTTATAIDSIAQE